MEPQVQYAQTKDGVSIAFCSMGEGLPVVDLQGQPFTNLQLFLQSPIYRPWLERLGRGRRLILLDGRGSGLSQRDVTDFSLDARVLDVEAVADRLGLERFALMGVSNAVPVGISYAVRHPGRVSHLVLWEGFARGADYYDSSRLQALAGLLEQDWELFTETAAHVTWGWSQEESRQFANLMRESITPSSYKAFREAARTVDVTHLLPKVAAPTLVVQMKGTDQPVTLARDLASHIPDARLAVLEGSWLAAFSDPEGG